MFNPNNMSRSERRDQIRSRALRSIFELPTSPVCVPASSSRNSVADMMMFSMDPSHPKLVSNFTVDVLPAPASTTGRNNRQPAAVSYVGCQRPPTFFPRRHDLVPQPKKRIVGFCIADAERSASDSDDNLRADSDGGSSD